MTTNMSAERTAVIRGYLARALHESVCEYRRILPTPVAACGCPEKAARLHRWVDANPCPDAPVSS